MFQIAKIMTGYCLYKLLTTFISIYLGRERGIDPINRVLKLFFNVND
jgi:hypothetical protein